MLKLKEIIFKNDIEVEVEFQGHVSTTNDSYDDAYGTVKFFDRPECTEIIWDKSKHNEEENKIIQVELDDDYLGIARKFEDLAEKEKKE